MPAIRKSSNGEVSRHATQGIPSSSQDSPPGPVDYPRRRAAIACEVCRQRKTRCDGVKPQCGFCKEIDQQCFYRPAPPAPPSKLERDMAKLLQRTENIEKFLSVLAHQNPTTVLPPKTVEEVPKPLPTKGEPVDTLGNNPVLYIHYPPNADGPREQTAWKSIQHSLVYSLHQSAGLEFPFSEYFEREMSSPAFPFPLYQDSHHPLPKPLPEEIDRMFALFFEKVHCWYPFLDPPSCINEYAHPVRERSAWYCKFLLIMALGSLAEDDRPTRDLNFAEQYAYPAFSMLPTIISSGDLLSAQCLILISLYCMWLLRPAHAFMYISQASLKIQNLLYLRLLRDDIHKSQDRQVYEKQDLQERELEKRAFWAAYIIESVHRLNYVNPGSRLDSYEDSVGLPYSEEDPFPPCDGPNGIYLQAGYYFLAHIRQRQTINRGKEARKPGKNLYNAV